MDNLLPPLPHLFRNLRVEDFPKEDISKEKQLADVMNSYTMENLCRSPSTVRNGSGHCIASSPITETDTVEMGKWVHVKSIFDTVYWGLTTGETAEYGGYIYPTIFQSGIFDQRDLDKLRPFVDKIMGNKTT